MSIAGSKRTEAGMLLLLDDVELMHVNAKLVKDRGRDAAP